MVSPPIPEDWSDQLSSYKQALTMILSQPLCPQRLDKHSSILALLRLHLHWGFFTDKIKTLTVASWLFQIPWLNSSTEERGKAYPQKILTKVNPRIPCSLRILGKYKQPTTSSLPPPGILSGVEDVISDKTLSL